MLEELTSVQGELTVSTDREVTAVLVPRVIAEWMESAKVGNRDEFARGLMNVQGELTVATDTEVIAGPIPKAVVCQGK